MAPWGSGRRGLRVSLSIFCFIVTVLQNSETALLARFSAVTESVTKPWWLRYKSTGHCVLLSIFGRFAGKNLKDPTSSRIAVTGSVTNCVTDDLLRAPLGAGRRTTNQEDKQRKYRCGHTEPMQHIKRDEPLNAIAGN
jgi:hypothetical protein